MRQGNRIRGVLFGSSRDSERGGRGGYVSGVGPRAGGGRSKISASAGRFWPANCKVCSDQERMSRPSTCASHSITRAYALIYNGRPRLGPTPGTLVPDSDLQEETPESGALLVYDRAIHSPVLIQSGRNRMSPRPIRSHPFPSVPIRSHPFVLRLTAQGRLSGDSGSLT